MSIIVATFGDDTWQTLAAERAVPSALAQPAELVRVHDATLHEARNRGAHEASGEWLVFLDADDELTDNYITHLAAGTADLRAPSVMYLRNGQGRARMPKVAGHAHTCQPECLPYGNWLVIGSMIRASLFHEVGGFADWPVYEDWDLWLRCWQHGATIEPIPGAVYRAHVRHDSRNRGSLTQAAKHTVHQQIAEARGVPVPA